MSKLRKVVLASGGIALGLTMGVGASLADGWGRHHGRGHHGGFGPGVFERLDADGDGRVTQAEIDEGRQGRLAEFDRDGDGSLSLEEFEGLWMAVMRERMVDRFQALDADGDGSVTSEEFIRPFSHMVSRLDRNGDGELTADELQRRHKGRKRN